MPALPAGGDRRAIREFAARVEASIRCVTHARLQLAEGRAGGESMVSIARRTVLAQQDRLPLTLSILHLFTVEQGRVHTREYACDVEFDGEAVQFHRHPGTGVDYPHINLRNLAPRSRLKGLHVPTARMSIERVVRFTVMELGAVPVTPGWESTLLANEQEFAARCSWWLTPPA